MDKPKRGAVLKAPVKSEPNSYALAIQSMKQKDRDRILARLITRPSR
jgi:hypothetical protein